MERQGARYDSLQTSPEDGAQQGKVYKCCSWITKRCSRRNLIRFCIFALMLGALTGTKYSFFRLAGSIQLVFNATTANDTEHVTMIPRRIRTVRVMMMLFIILMVPCVINVLRALPELLPGGKRKSGEERKSGGKRKSARASPVPQSTEQQDSAQQNTATSKCWTPRCRYVYCALIAFFESFGQALFCFKIIPGYDYVTSLLLMTSVVIFPSEDILFLVNKCCCKSDNLRLPDLKCSACKRILWIVGLVAQVVSMVLFFITWTQSEPRVVWHVPVAWVSLVLSWFLYPCVAIAAAGKQTGLAGRPGNGNQSNTVQNGDIEFEEKITIWTLTMTKSITNIFSVSLFTFIFVYVDKTLYSTDEWWTEVMLEEFKAAWQWEWNSETQLALRLVLYGLLAYFLAMCACQLRLICLVLSPAIVLAMLLEGLLEFLYYFCVLKLEDSKYVCLNDQKGLKFLLPAYVLGIFGQAFSQGIKLCWDSAIVLQRESHAFNVPGFQSFALEQWLMTNRRRRPATNGEGNTLPPTKVFICSTMYREAKHEMKTLLESIAKINDYKWEDNWTFECHIILDCGAKGDHLTPFAKQLESLILSTFSVKKLTGQQEQEEKDGEKVSTPYGPRLKWKLPETRGHQMTVCVHLKDPLKVKRKKRWSQVLYLNYVLKWLLEKDQEKCGLENSFILATDGDVEFEPSSVKKLLDLMLRDKTVGGVCARTHPKGSGPMFWYQEFEYAIGHWFQKATEHILGSVLCAPGCFSVYRCQALLDVLDTYASNVEEAFDFLTKDMGEDRWLCTLMIQAGWRIDYCAVASCRTYCPEDFDEFFKQRRRWVVSTLANLKLLLTEGLKDSKMQMQWVFILYQKLLLVASIVSPATVIIFVAKGLWYAWDVNSLAMTIVQLFVCATFTVVCLLTPTSVQLKVAKVLCTLYAFAVTAVTVGALQEIVEEIKHDKPDEVYDLIIIPLSLSTLYLVITIGIFIMTALLHWEFCTLIRGLLYILVFPTTFIILNIYCLVNVTDKSWGTREDKVRPSVKEHKQPSYILVWKKVTKLFSSCKKQQRQHQHDLLERCEEGRADEREERSDRGKKKSSKVEGWLRAINQTFPDHPAFVEICDRFRENGFDNKEFISGMNQRELRDIGITDLGHVHFLSRKIEELNSFDIAPGIPTAVGEWLEAIGLGQYRDNFKNALILDPKDLPVLKEFSTDDIRRELKIHKVGHIKRLLYAIKQLRQSTEEEKEKHDEVVEGQSSTAEETTLKTHAAKQSDSCPDQSKTKGKLQEEKEKRNDVVEGKSLTAEETTLKTHAAKQSDPCPDQSKTKGKFQAQQEPNEKLKEISVEEGRDFLDDIVKKQLDPSPDEFRIEGELQEKLDKLRNSWLMILGVTNVIWLILVTTLASHRDLVIYGTNPLAFFFMLVFGVVFTVQLLCMVRHRLQSLIHWLARTGRPCPGDCCCSRWLNMCCACCSDQTSGQTGGQTV